MIFRYVKHKEADDLTITRICSIKDESWKYGSTAQRKWIYQHISSSDIHLLGLENEELVAYLNITSFKGSAEKKTFDALGIGNVCVAANKKGQGYGGMLVDEVSKYLLYRKMVGFLLCSEKLIAFYAKHDWILVSPERITADFQIEGTSVMTYGLNTLELFNDAAAIHLSGRAF